MNDFKKNLSYKDRIKESKSDDIETIRRTENKLENFERTDIQNMTPSEIAHIRAYYDSIEYMIAKLYKERMIIENKKIEKDYER